MITEQHGNRVCRGRRKSDRELEVQFELMRIIAEQNHEVTFEYDVEFDRAAFYEVVNGTFTEKRAFEDYTKKIDEYISVMEPEDAKAYKKVFLKCLKKPSHFVLDLRMPFVKNKMEWYRLFLASVDDLEGNITTIAGRFVSIHAEKIANENIKHKAEIDALTGVYNHITFENVSEEKLKNCKDNLLFMMLDIDDFKIINDTLGHNVGDLVLSQTGDILNHYVGDKGFAGRLGGDEFAVMAWGFADDAEMKQFSEELRMELKKIIFDMEYSASIGVAFLSGRNFTFKDLYYEADQAVYTAKRRGKNQVVFFDEAIIDSPEIVDDPSHFIPLDGNRRINVSELSQDRMAIDKLSDYILIVDTDMKKIVQTNRAAREVLLCGEDEWLNMSCVDFFGKCSGICENCGGKNEQYFYSKASERVDSVLTKLFGPKNFLVHIIPGQWRGLNMRKIFLMDIENSKQISAIFNKKNSATNAMQTFIDYILRSQGEYDYKYVIRMACDYYNSDCGMVVYSNGGRFDSADMITKPNVKVMGDIVMHTIEDGRIKNYLEFLNRTDSVYLMKIDKLKKLNSKLYKALVDARIFNVIAIRIGKAEQPYGALILLNSRQNEEDDKISKFTCAFFTDELTRKDAIEELEYSQDFDPLTGVYSRASLNKQNIEIDTSYLKSLGIFATDIIGLKMINREFGYENGNRRLCELADSISSIFAGYHVCRYEDDQIVAFCENIDEDAFHKLVKWATETVEDLGFPVAVGYGWSTEANIRRQMSDLIEMMTRDKMEKLELISTDSFAGQVQKDVRELMDNDSFYVYLQPKVSMKTGKTVGAEALIRLNDPEKGIVPPVHFISIFEKYNIIHEIDLYVLKKVCQFQAEKLKNNQPIVPISVNFSKKTLEYDKLIQYVSQVMKEYELPMGSIQIEITETVGDMDHMLIKEVANSLRMMGFVLAMDDFGTKYSNIAMLVQFEFEIAKIDRSLIKNLTENDKSVVVLRHMTQMIKDLGIECVIEGAETEEQIEILKSIDCDVVQGYYYGKPVDSSNFYEMFME